MNSITVCGVNAINAIADAIHGNECGKTDRKSLQIRIQDAKNQLESMLKHLQLQDGVLYPTEE